MKMDKKPRAANRHYDMAFRQEALRLWKSSGKSAEGTAQELGIPSSELYRWRRQLSPPLGAGLAAETKEELHAEVIRLREEVERLTEQREILKKAAGILSEPPRRGMPGSKH
jgi:transposase